MLNNVEEWRDISGYEGLYKVSKFENGLRNVDISRILGIPTALVGTYKYKWKKGEKLC